MLALIFAAVGSYILYENKKENTDPAIILIDGKKIRASSLKNFKMDGKPCESVEKCLDSFINQQLLVIYAEKSGLNNLPELKDLNPEALEEKMAETALEKAYSSISPDLSENEKNAYLSLYKGKVAITTYVYDDLESAKSGGDPTGKFRIIPFEKLSGRTAYIISMLEPGSKTMPYKTGSSFEIIQLDILEQDLSAIARISDSDRNKMLEKLEKDKKEFLFEKWKSDLREKADIKTTEKLKEVKL